MSRNAKVRTLEELGDIVAGLKAGGKQVVQAHGVFDLLHIGHIRHFEEARAMGDALVVTLTADPFVNKGPSRPVFGQDLRAEAIAALGMVDYVAVNHSPLAVDAIAAIKPSIYVKGQDYADAAKDRTGGIVHETEAVRAVGGDIRFTDDITFSSSNLLNRHFSSLPEEANRYLEGFRQHYSTGDVIARLDALRGLKVLLVGEAILDEYVYGDVIGKSGKEPILAMRYDSREIHAGGVLAIANHLSQFCEQVDLITYLGADNPRQDLICSQLMPNVRPEFITKAASPTIVKRRYVEKYLVQKLLEIYEINDAPLAPDEDARLCAMLEERLGDYDVVIAADYGHGMLSDKAIRVLARRSRFLAANTQVNAANVGFHTISKYSHADYVCIHEGEVRLDHRSRSGDLHDLVKDLAERINASTVMITRGKYGTLSYRHGEGFAECPAFAVRVVDRVGAGDAVLAMTALCAAKGEPLDLLGFVGNVVGAQAVTIVGNSRAIDRVGLYKSIEAILK